MAHRDSNLEAKPERDLEAAVEHTFRLVQQDEHFQQSNRPPAIKARDSYPSRRGRRDGGMPR